LKVKRLKHFLSLLILGIFLQSSIANNVQITNVSYSSSTIAFDLSWENSWYAGFGFHDAVWIFVKYAPNGGPAWQHATISAATVDAGYTTSIPSDEVGFFVRRSSTGNGTASTSVTVNLNPLMGAFQDIKVMGVEMVYVPTDSFYAGDGATNGRIARGDDATQSVHITSNTGLTCGTTANDIQYSPSVVCDDIPNTYPLGYNAFYCMKYTITQSQYVDFLNCLSRTQQENRVNADITGSTVANYFVMNDADFPNRGSVIRCDENVGSGRITFYCDRNNNGVPNEADDGLSRACNYLKVTDWAAYLDWSGLRPMSFLEFEKASRGPLPAVANEYSWGSALWTNNGSVVDAGLDSEKWSNSNIEGGISTYSDDVIRVGCNASSTGASRELSNASYYGIIDLGNNPGDWYVSDDYVSTYTALEGDGNLAISGNADVSSWPEFDDAAINNIKIALLNTGISNLGIGNIGGTSNAGGRGIRSNF